MALPKVYIAGKLTSEAVVKLHQQVAPFEIVGRLEEAQAVLLPEQHSTDVRANLILYHNLAGLTACAGVDALHYWLLQED